MRIAFFEHSDSDLPGLLGERAAELGLTSHSYRADLGPAQLPGVDDFDLLVVLGSDHSVTDPSLGWIDSERRLVTEAVAAGVPVLGVCFGAQLLAQVLGGSVTRAVQLERGWHRVVTDDDTAFPPGPWLMWHSDHITGPPGARVVAMTDVCLQAYVSGVHTGVQFHPEATLLIVRRWVDEARIEAGMAATEAEHLLSGFGDSAGCRIRARALFDGFLSRADQRG